MVRKPGKMYRSLAKKAYTRREYMGGVPGNKIVQFEMGNLSQEFPTEVDLIVEESCQIRHSALEASRISINRKLMKDVGRTNFHFKVRVFPHHVLRENKQATGAGADRVSEGMRLAFGKAVGTAARVEAGQIIFTVYSNAQYLDKIKAAMRNGAHKLPTPSHLKVHTIKVSGRIIAAPKIAGDKIAAPVKVETEAEAAAAAAAEPAKGAEAAKGAEHKGGKGPAKAEPVKAEPAKGAEAAKGADHKGGAHKGGKK
ncbi:MAG: 50S ribosomal protein L16 [Methanoregula sp.]|jgi:large subunit ribosomal protein L10e|uniref:50S ribosomal protein L16 n=1 Tax=Methanoregula sp. TaxID=2052170 RepID=UPI003D0E7334